MSDPAENILTPQVQELLRDERDLLVSLRESLEGDQGEDRRRIQDLLEGLSELFTVVIVGEFNAGKSSLINALFGRRLREEGPVPVDDRISLLRHGDEASTRRISEFVVEESYPVDFLRTIRLVDTPGTNSIVRRHQEITEDYIPRADLVLFVTSIDRPLSESERTFLEFIREWRKKIVFVLNKIDTKNEEEIARVLDYLTSNIRGMWGIEPTVFPLSARMALGSKEGAESPRAWTASRFEEFEDYVFRVLSESEKMKLKLQSPLDAARGVIDRQFSVIESREKILASDVARIEAIRTQLASADEDLRENFSRFVTRIDNMILELERRGIDFLDRMIRINHILLLRDPLRFREEFQRQVFLEWEGSVDRTIQESVDWLVGQNMKLWNSTVEEFHRRPDLEAAPGDLVGQVGREFAYNREQVYSRIRVEAEQRMRSYDVGTESREMIDSAVRGVVQSLGLGAGAIGLGYLVSSVFTSFALDVTGLTAATMLLVSSFLVLPYKRSRAKSGFREKIERLRSQMSEAIISQSDVEIRRMLDNIGEAFEPYLRFYRTESERIGRISSRLGALRERASDLASRITRQLP